jgi:hypothetical protein
MARLDTSTDIESHRRGLKSRIQYTHMYNSPHLFLNSRNWSLPPKKNKSRTFFLFEFFSVWPYAPLLLTRLTAKPFTQHEKGGKRRQWERLERAARGSSREEVGGAGVLYTTRRNNTQRKKSFSLLFSPRLDAPPPPRRRRLVFSSWKRRHRMMNKRNISRSERISAMIKYQPPLRYLHTQPPIHNTMHSWWEK